MDKKILMTRIKIIFESLEQINQFKDLTYTQFLDFKNFQDICEYNLFIIINAMIDIVNHICSDLDYGNLDLLSDGFKVLGEKEIFNNNEVNNFINMVSFRNIIAHEYTKINKKIVFDIVKNKLYQIEDFIKIIKNNYLNE